ncbi:LysM peptidoglycan-binding domain-containing protein [Acetivibrio clariflavus]|uniref:LysM peptidoglycan-binding domain-containing protein n=1 Tax=Acetivibrio clariflavus TaxID=288965 RepID=UPI0004863F97|nr:LysM peptidoglycan-binding domain-containing protein [Acetivibrio clariflavus]
MPKKKVSVFLAAILGILLLTQVYVYAGENKVEIVVDNVSTGISVKTVSKNNITMIPAKELAESIRGNFTYDYNSMTGIITYKESEIRFRLDNDIVMFNGKYIKAPAPMSIEDYRFIVPLEFCCEELGIHCYMDYKKNLLYIYTQNSGDLIYNVMSGDSLWLISQKFGTTIDKIKQLNGLTSDIIYVNQKLIIKRLDPIDNSFVSYTSNNATLSSGTSLSVPPVGYLKAWTEVKVIGKNGDWYKVKTANGTGYIHKSVTYIKQDIWDDRPNSKYFENKINVDTSKSYITYKNYVVQKGDTLWTIGEKMGITDYELASANNISREAILYIGDVLKIPVHNIPVKDKVIPTSGEILDWFAEAQYVFPIGSVGKVIDIATGKSFMIKRTMGSGHADCETLTASDTKVMKEIFGGYWNWNRRPFILEFNGRRLAVSIAGMPHAGVDGLPFMQNVANRSDNYGYGPNYDTIANGMDGHFDLYFLNCQRHKDNKIDALHQQNVLIAGGLR